MKQIGAWRTTDPPTSAEAAQKVNVTVLEGIVIDYLRNHKMFGGTSPEIAQASGKDKWSISPRMAPLQRRDLIHDSGERRDGCIVWRIGPAPGDRPIRPRRRKPVVPVQDIPIPAEIEQEFMKCAVETLGHGYTPDYYQQAIINDLRWAYREGAGSQ